MSNPSTTPAPTLERRARMALTALALTEHALTAPPVEKSVVDAVVDSAGSVGELVSGLVELSATLLADLSRITGSGVHAQVDAVRHELAACLRV